MKATLICSISTTMKGWLKTGEFKDKGSNSVSVLDYDYEDWTGRKF